MQKPGLRQDLTQWIPHPGIAEAFIAKGVGKLYPWQAAALELGEDCSNLVYCAPTSGALVHAHTHTRTPSPTMPLVIYSP